MNRFALVAFSLQLVVWGMVAAESSKIAWEIAGVDFAVAAMLDQRELRRLPTCEDVVWPDIPAYCLDDTSLRGAASTNLHTALRVVER